ncbi:unnamed protein product [Echinostoma caproni]|uniref:UCH_1 domain-containing protein n=1 Tax=Echinostoma caproni TaxID=27848 RepID=A0A183ABG3_9TREM|nr:unnamed protein product [Echinostoma caproni]
MTNTTHASHFDGQVVSSQRDFMRDPSPVAMFSNQGHIVRKSPSTFNTRRVARVSVRHKRVFTRQSHTSYGTTTGTGTGTSAISTTTQLLNPALIHFICSRLPDPCARAAYLREHVRHELCLNIPFLYVLPNTTLAHDSRTHHPTDLYAARSGTCRESGTHSLNYVNSDSLFEVFLSSPNVCVRSLTVANQQIRDRLEPMFQEFDRLLDKSFCKKHSDLDLNVTGEFQCEECRVSASFLSMFTGVI